MCFLFFVFFFKQKTAYEIVDCDWSSDVCSSDLISPDGRLIASAGKDRSIKLWSMRSGNLIHTLKGHTGEVTAIALAPNQRTVVSASGDSSIKIWDTRSEERRVGKECRSRWSPYH